MVMFRTKILRLNSRIVNLCSIFWELTCSQARVLASNNHYIRRNTHKHTFTHSLNLILLLRCNAEQELVMHYMLLALAEVRGKQDQYYWPVYLSADHTTLRSRLPLETLNQTISNTLVLLFSNWPLQHRLPYLPDAKENWWKRAYP